MDCRRPRVCISGFNEKRIAIVSTNSSCEIGTRTIEHVRFSFVLALPPMFQVLGTCLEASLVFSFFAATPLRTCDFETLAHLLIVPFPSKEIAM